MADPSDAPAPPGGRLNARDPAGTATALGLALLGGAVVWQASAFSTLGKVFPIAIGGAMVLLCLALVARNVLSARRGPTRSETGVRVVEAPATVESRPAPGAGWRRVALLAIMGLWVALLPVLGFYAASLLGFLGSMAVTIHERVSAREGIVLAVAAVVFPLGFWLLMVEVLRIPVPRGLLF